MIRWLLAAALAVAAATMPAAAKNTLRWTSQSEIQTVDPHAQHDPTTDSVNLSLFDPLVRRNAKEELEPGLAVSWRTVDPLTWEFKLRAGVRFHDGTPFTADDVIFSIRRAKGQHSDFIRYVADIVAVAKVDDLTIRISTRLPDPILPGRLTRICIMSMPWAVRHKAERPQDFAVRENTHASRNANGTGPFALKRFEPGGETVIERNPRWWGWGTPQGGGNLDEVIYKPIRSALRRSNALMAGEVDFVPDLAPLDLEKARKDPRFKVLQATQNRTIFLGLDQGSAELRSADVKGKNPFADKRVRQAMQAAIDQQTIRRVVMRGAAVPSGIILPPFVRGHTAALDKPAAHNLDAGKALMKQAGFAAGFTVRLDCPNDRYVNDEQICQALVGMLGRLGIRAQLHAAAKEAHLARLRRGDSDLFLLGWAVPTYDSHYVLAYLYATRSDTAGLWNLTGYSDKKMDDLIARIEVEIDAKKRDALVAEAWAQAKADLVYIPLHHQMISWAMTKAVDLPITPDDEPHFRWAKIVAPRR